MKLQYGTLFFVSFFVTACGMTGFLREPGFFRYPFEEFAHIQLSDDQYISPDTFIIDDAASKTLLTLESENTITYWENNTSYSAELPDDSEYRGMLALPGRGLFLMWCNIEATGDFLRVYQIEGQGGGIAALTLKGARQIDSEDFSGITIPDYLPWKYQSGRVYAFINDSTNYYFISYEANAEGIDSPQIDAVISIDDIRTEFFAEETDQHQTYWNDFGFSIEEDIYLPDSETAAMALSIQNPFTFETVKRKLLLWDGNSLSGRDFESGIANSNYQFLKNGSAHIPPEDTNQYYTKNRFYDLFSMELIAEMEPLGGLSFFAEGITGDDTMLYFFQETGPMEAGLLDYIIYTLPFSAVTGAKP